MIQDLHVHTCYCDGKSTPRQVVMSAIDKGISVLGFSGHCYTEYDVETGMSREDTKRYIAEIGSLKEEFKDKITILCGIEQDYYAVEPTDCYDYVIGSVHYLKLGDEYPAIDLSPEGFVRLVEESFGGDYYAIAEEYYRLVADVARKLKPDIIGHFDLITKYNEGDRLFDTKNPRYVAAWKAAADALLKYDIPFEINSGAISRGYRTTPYPAIDILEYICQKGGKIVINSDSHHADTLLYEFDKSFKIARAAGFVIQD